MAQPPPPDPEGKDLPILVISALSIPITPYEEQTISRLVLWSDRSEVLVLASLIIRARTAAANEAIRSSLFEIKNDS